MDRISSLPDEILCQILSSFPIKEAALTSVLSKRWRYLFALRQNLSFNDFEYQNPNTSYRDFMDRVLTVSEKYSLKEFTLKDRHSHKQAPINRWIRNVLSRGVVDLRLSVTGGIYMYSLPLEVFSCKTIVNLELGMGFQISIVPENASLPALKTLFLDHIEFRCNFEALISACHVLEELTMRVPGFNHWTGCRIVSCPTLRRLIIKCKLCKSFDLSRSITFDTPNLAYLHYCDSVPDDFPIVNLESLVEAKLTLASRIIPNKGNPMNLIKGLRNVEILELSSLQTSEAFNSFREAIPVFKNLLCLSVTTDSRNCCPSLRYLVKNSPNLHTLVLKGTLHYDPRLDYDEHADAVCVCLSGYSFLESCPVEVLEITEYMGTKGDLAQMKHFLEKLRCLELVKVWFSETDDKKQLRLTKDLLRLPRPSECKIQFKFISS